MTNRRDSEIEFVVCIKNDDYPASLELCKVYRVVFDADAAARDLIRVIDESGEDYLYPSNYFVPIELPPDALDVVCPLLDRLPQEMPVA